jgi:hypothetical protein
VLAASLPILASSGREMESMMRCVQRAAASNSVSGRLERFVHCLVASCTRCFAGSNSGDQWRSF